jgi:nucleoid DNA-binding protein
MNKYLIEILKAQSSVIIPGLGSLMVVSSKSGKIVFNPHLKFNDGSLAKFIAEKENVDVQEAQNMVAKFVREIEAELGKGNSYDVFEFGKFDKTADGEITFIMEEAKSSIASEPVKEVKPEKKEKKKEEKKAAKTDEKPADKPIVVKAKEEVEKKVEAVKEKTEEVSKSIDEKVSTTVDEMKKAKEAAAKKLEETEAKAAAKLKETKEEVAQKTSDSIEELKAKKDQFFDQLKHDDKTDANKVTPAATSNASKEESKQSKK